MLDTVKINHVQHISFTQSRLTDAVSVILNGLLSYEHPPKPGVFHRRVKPSTTSHVSRHVGTIWLLRKTVTCYP